MKPLLPHLCAFSLLLAAGCLLLSAGCWSGISEEVRSFNIKKGEIKKKIDDAKSIIAKKPGSSDRDAARNLLGAARKEIMALRSELLPTDTEVVELDKQLTQIADLEAEVQPDARAAAKGATWADQVSAKDNKVAMQMKSWQPDAKQLKEMGLDTPPAMPAEVGTGDNNPPPIKQPDTPPILDPIGTQNKGQPKDPPKNVNNNDPGPAPTTGFMPVADLL